MEKGIFTCSFWFVMGVLCCCFQRLDAQEKRLTGSAADSVLVKGKQVASQTKSLTDSLASAPGYAGALMDKTWKKYADEVKSKWQGLSFFDRLNPGVVLENKGTFLNSPVEGKSRQWFNTTTLGLRLEVAKLPIRLELSGQYNPITGYQFGSSNLFKLQSDFVNPQERMKQFMDRFDGDRLQQELGKKLVVQGKQVYESQLNYAENKLKHINSQELQELVKKEGGMSGLLGKSETDLQRTFTIVRDRERRKIEAHKDLAEHEKEVQYNKINKRIDSLSALVTDLKQRLSSLGINDERSALLNRYFKKEITNESLEKGLLSSFVKTDDRLSKANDALGLLKSFKTGHFGQTVPGNLLNRDLFVKGVDFSLKAGKMPLELGIGKHSDMVSAKDALFERSSFSSPRLVSYVSASLYRFSGVSGKLSIVNAAQKAGNSDLGASVLVAPRNNLAVSFEQDMDFKRLGQLHVELSRTTNNYRQGSMEVSEMNFVRNDALSSFFNTELDQSLSVGLQHQIDLEKAGLSQRVYFNYAGIGYQSPGLQGNLNTKMRVGGAVKKYLFKRRVSLNVRGDLRNTPISLDGNDAWRNHQLQTDAAIRLGKQTTLRLSYNNNATNRLSEEVIPTFKSEKYQGGINIGYKLLGQSALSHLSVGQQYFSNFGETVLKGNFMTLNLAQTVLLGSQMLSANIFYNREVSTVKMMGNILNADMTYQFNILEHVVVSPGLTYLDNKGVARQMGVKSGIQYVGGKHFSIGGSADVRRNFYDPLFPQLYSNCRAEVNFNYYLGGRK